MFSFIKKETAGPVVIGGSGRCSGVHRRESVAFAVFELLDHDCDTRLGAVMPVCHVGYSYRTPGAREMPVFLPFASGVDIVSYA